MSKKKKSIFDYIKSFDDILDENVIFNDIYRPVYLNDEKTNYMASVDGDVYSIDYKHQGITKRLKTTLGHDGYEYIALSYKDGKRKNFRLNRLIAKVFIPIPEIYIERGLTEDDLEVNHIDGDILNNKVSNLEWLTPEENKSHAWENRLLCFGEDNKKSKINSEIAHKICQELEQNRLSQSDIARKFNVSFDIVSEILHKHTWVDVSSLYNFDHYNARGGNYVKGDRSNFNIHGENKVIAICKELVKNELSQREIDDKYNVSHGYTHKILKRQIWKDVSKEFDFSHYNRDGR